MPTEKPPVAGGFSSSPPRGGGSFTWHRAIFAGSYPPTIVAAAAFHNRVRDGSVWFHSAMDTRIDLQVCSTPFPPRSFATVVRRLNPENCIGESQHCRARSSGKVVIPPLPMARPFGIATGIGRLRTKCWSSPRSISTPPLHRLPGFHVEPINGCSARDLTG